MRRNAPLAPLSTFGIGGRAEWLQTVSSPEELIEAVKLVRKSRRRYKIIAGGSNVVFPDSMLRGVLIRVLDGELELRGNVITADAGVPLRDVIDRSIRAGL